MQGFLEALSTHDLATLIRSIGVELPDEPTREVCHQAILESDRIPQVLAGALKHPDAKVRAQAADALGEVGDATSKSYLQSLMTDRSGEVRSAVIKSLQRIDARKGEDKTEIETEHEGLPTDYVRQLVLDATAHLKASFTPSRNGFMLNVDIGKGKAQYVQVIFGKKDEENSPYISFLSVCGRPSPQTLPSLLRWNGRLTCGSVSLRKVGPEEVLVLGAAQAMASANYDEIEKTILYLAKRGYTLKQFLRAGY